MLKVAMLSGWHVHAKGYAKELNGMNNVKITAVWDENTERGSKWANELGISFEPDLEVLLKRNDVDAVVVTTPTNMHTEVMVAAANAGKHIFTEKVMALTTKECYEIAEAVRKAGVKFCISFPHRTRSPMLYAKKVVEDKLIGDITLLRIRNAHNGSVGNWLPEHFYDPIACGGGAMMDLGAHSMYLSRWLLGKPVRITSMFNSYTNRGVEDNAVSIIEFENKALAIEETGFVSTASPFKLELYGTDGCLLYEGNEESVRIISRKPDSKKNDCTIISQLPPSLPRPIEQWVNAILSGTEIPFGLEEGIQLTELMEGAYLSYKEGRVVEFK